MAAGRPVVATDVGGAREAVVDSETGFIVRPEDFETMATRLISLLTEPERAWAMGEQGRKRVLEQFSCEAQLGRVEQLYEGLLGR
jgi:glycosyltransferase involved in cell wall biosynthesis